MILVIPVPKDRASSAPEVSEVANPTAESVPEFIQPSLPEFMCRMRENVEEMLSMMSFVLIDSKIKKTVFCAVKKFNKI